MVLVCASHARLLHAQLLFQQVQLTVLLPWPRARQSFAFQQLHVAPAFRLRAVFSLLPFPYRQWPLLSPFQPALSSLQQRVASLQFRAREFAFYVKLRRPSWHRPSSWPQSFSGRRSSFSAPPSFGPQPSFGPRSSSSAQPSWRAQPSSGRQFSSLRSSTSVQPSWRAQPSSWLLQPYCWRVS